MDLYLMDWKACKLQVCNLVLIELAQAELEVNKHPKFDNNFDFRRQLEHFEYEMIHALKFANALDLFLF